MTLDGSEANKQQFGFVCVVTGSSSPIGKAVLHELAAHGAANLFACIPTSSTADVGDALLKEMTEAYPNTKVVPYPLDVTDENDTLAFIDNILDDCGRLDVWVCASGLLGPASIEDTGPPQIQKCFEVNTVAPFLALKYARRAMEKTCGKKNYPNSAPKDSPYGSVCVSQFLA